MGAHETNNHSHCTASGIRTALEDVGKERNVVVTWTGDGNTSAKLSWTGTKNQIRFPLRPDPKALEPIEVNLHGSPTLALDMGEEFTKFFSLPWIRGPPGLH